MPIASASRPTMLFHVPYPLAINGTSASSIRPRKMREAFESIGYEVIEISGNVDERKRAIKKAKELFASGEQLPEFVYSEASTLPTALTEPHHIPIKPMMDLNFLKYCKSLGIPVGLFYRDIYWKFNQFDDGVNRIKSAISKFFYQADLVLYRNSIDTLFLPSRRMANYLPAANQAQVAPSPPGAVLRNSLKTGKNLPLSLLYVGGVGYQYQLHLCVDAISKVPEISMTICTRETEWKEVQQSYGIEDSDCIEVVHKSGSELDELYARADIGVLFIKIDEYWDFTAPVKLYEYLGAGIPIIVTEGSLAADIVRSTNSGWVVPYEESEIVDLLTHLTHNPREVLAKSKNARIIGINQTWISRAQAVSNHLTGVRPIFLGAETEHNLEINELVGLYRFQKN